MSQHGTVIVGTGHAGAQAAIALRHCGYADSINLIGSDPDLPYERPPLSKEYLLGDRNVDQLLIRPAAFWTERLIHLSPNTTIVSVDPLSKMVIDTRGNTIPYRHLIWAAGGMPRRLTCDGHMLAGIHYLRDRADADRLMQEMPTARQAVVIGGGFIGLEAAAALRKRNVPVVLLEAQDRILARVAGEPLSRFFEAQHRARGVDIRLGATVKCVEGENGRVRRVLLADGTAIDADLIVVGIGIVPSSQPLAASGAEGTNGIRVDERCRTSLPDIFAIGDCALHRNRHADHAEVRLESVQNANDMAITVARQIVGEGTDYDAIPWFWSNQYDLKMQTVGLSTGYDETIIRGDPATRSFSLIYRRKGFVVALDAVNCVRDYAQGKAMVAARALVDREALADVTKSIKSLLPA